MSGYPTKMLYSHVPMDVTCPIPAFRFYLIVMHISLIAVYRCCEVDYQYTIFDHWNTCYDLDPS
jgi:hypothetical protein